jgi:glycyl-tRNA synthetase beta chain
VADARARVELLRRLRREERLPLVQAVVQRASRLAAKGDLAPAVLAPAGVVNPSLFESPAENAMLEALQQLAPIAAGARGGNYRDLASGLAASADTLAAFFDGPQSVLVMADDPAVRRNRLNLLGVLRNQSALLADFERISGG